ncbi:hypothetical protein SBV1_80020 [Verrucomicrobia bacterium]|nr:hypothetical protein SBV1_80020 [Verrucomicrobiota bacterium]
MWWYCAFLPAAWAGGSGLNTVVIVNQNSSNSLALANYYCERRQVPPANVLFINWTGGNIWWTNGDFVTNLLQPLLTMLAARQLTNQIDYVVLSMDIPYQLNNGSSVNSTTSALFYGMKSDSGPDWVGSTNSYAASELAFRQAPPASAPGYSFLTTMITGTSLAQAEQLVDQGVNSDGTFPTQPVVLAKSSDPLRNIRFSEFDNTIFNSRVSGNCLMVSTNSDSPLGQTNLLGYQTGLADFDIGPNTFVPGAMADSLTSFGGYILAPAGQTTLLAFIGAGAAGSYGTVVEPSPSLDKFPNPQAYFYQARGFSLAECYYQSLVVPYEGLIVAEPLAAPFQRPGAARWQPTPNPQHKTAYLTFNVSAVDASHPLAQADLFVDGVYYETLTNVGPQPGNVLTLTLNGYPLSYTVPTNASLTSMANDLAALVNSPSCPFSNNIAAWAYGDRLELHVTTNGQSVPVYFSDSSVTNSDGRLYRAVNLQAPVPPAIASVGREPNGGFRIQLNAPANAPYLVEASTNLADWTPVFTNLAGGSLQFVDLSAPAFPRKFYRTSVPRAANQPVLSAPRPDGLGNYTTHVAAPSGLGYAIEASRDLAAWTAILTNLAGGALDFVDPQSSNCTFHFFRARVLPPQLTPVTPGPGTNPWFRIDGASQPYLVQVSTNGASWTTLFANLNIGETTVSASSSAGNAKVGSTFLTATANTFLDSQVTGTLYVDLHGVVNVGDTVTMEVTKTDGSLVSLTVTNSQGTDGLASFAQQLSDLVNSTPALEGSDGILAADLFSDFSMWSGFTLYARSFGLQAAGIQVQLSTSGFMLFNPPSQIGLTNNLSDLEPRTHLYLSGGARHLGFTLNLDTTPLADGFHEVTVVGYEGTSVRTQARATLPITIQNTPLTAVLTPLDLGATAPVQGTYHIQVAANTNNISTISLFSTGGVLATVTNQASTIFSVNGASLGVGLHPFYALVQTATGLQYRTQTFSCRFQ